jgi:endonuclease YncB( thermonuclease family)
MKVTDAVKYLVAVAFFVLFVAITFGVGIARDSGTFNCPVPRVTDGDTFRCGQTRIRLYGIDAPELPGHCRQGRTCVSGDPWAATRNLDALLHSGAVICRAVDVDAYGRTVARCSAGDVDLSCSQLSGGFAVRRYGSISC